MFQNLFCRAADKTQNKTPKQCLNSCLGSGQNRAKATAYDVLTMFYASEVNSPQTHTGYLYPGVGVFRFKGTR